LRRAVDAGVLAGLSCALAP